MVYDCRIFLLQLCLPMKLYDFLKLVYLGGLDDFCYDKNSGCSIRITHLGSIVDDSSVLIGVRIESRREFI